MVFIFSLRETLVVEELLRKLDFIYVKSKSLLIRALREEKLQSSIMNLSCDPKYRSFSKPKYSTNRNRVYASIQCVQTTFYTLHTFCLHIF